VTLLASTVARGACNNVEEEALRSTTSWFFMSHKTTTATMRDGQGGNASLSDAATLVSAVSREGRAALKAIGPELRNNKHFVLMVPLIA
jgi:hypothetical protein